MRAILPVFILAAGLTACTNTPNIGAPQSATPAVDTAGLAAFKEWKNQQAGETKPRTVYVVKHVPVQRAGSNQAHAPVYNNTPSSSEGTVADVPGATQPQATEKKGWSKAAKGAAIGAGSGAVLGAVVHKRNRVVGGVVGGAVGAGVGYGIGRHMDKKDGRY